MIACAWLYTFKADFGAIWQGFKDVVARHCLTGEAGNVPGDLRFGEVEVAGRDDGVAFTGVPVEVLDTVGQLVREELPRSLGLLWVVEGDLDQPIEAVLACHEAAAVDPAAVPAAYGVSVWRVEFLLEPGLAQEAADGRRVAVVVYADECAHVLVIGLLVLWI